MELRPLSLEDMEQIRIWRNSIPETTRTPFLLTKEQQQDYYRTVICDRNGTTRYWGFWVDCGDLQPDSECLHLAGYGGIENIQWDNRLGEISVLISPDYRGKGLGREAVVLILDRAFNYMGLENVHGECYYSSAAVDFWKKLLGECDGKWVDSPGPTKFYNGKWWHSMYFNFNHRNWVFLAKPAPVDDPVVGRTCQGFLIRQSEVDRNQLFRAKEYGNA